MNAVLLQITRWLQPYYADIATVLVATVLVIYGDVLNKQIKAWIRPYPFLLKTLLFVLICAFGYGAILVFISPWVQRGILYLPALYQGIAVVLAFWVCGLLAQQRRYI